jgi:hypothetical protein
LAEIDGGDRQGLRLAACTRQDEAKDRSIVSGSLALLLALVEPQLVAALAPLLEIVRPDTRQSFARLRSSVS